MKFMKYHKFGDKDIGRPSRLGGSFFSTPGLLKCIWQFWEGIYPSRRIEQARARTREQFNDV